MRTKISQAVSGSASTVRSSQGPGVGSGWTEQQDAGPACERDSALRIRNRPACAEEVPDNCGSPDSAFDCRDRERRLHHLALNCFFFPFWAKT